VARRLEDRLAELAAIRGDPTAAGALAAVRAAVRSNTGVLVAAAAHIIAEHNLLELLPELPAAFARLTDRPIQRDPGCRGKTAVARALHDLDRWDDDVFPAGARYVQREPVWGGSEDTAGELRGVCGYAYAHVGHPDALRVLAELLADPERVARAGAARALADAGRVDADALVRYKLLQGDPDPEVIAACFASLLVLEGEDALDFIARFLDGGDDDDATAEAAVLALGESRLDAALPILRRWCDDAMIDEAQRVGYLAVALLRNDPATDYLLDVIRTAAPTRAVHAVHALATFRDDATLAKRVRTAAADADDAIVRAEAAAQFA
jgi:hypothetical protein